MENVFIGIIIVPGIFALLFFFVFSYLYRQSHEPYFRAWQLAWAAYCLQYALLAWNYFSTENAFAFIASKLLFCGVAAAILVSTRLVQEDYRPHWSDAVLAAGAVALTVHNLLAHMDNGRFQAMARPHLELDVGIAFVLALSAARFYRLGRQRDSAGFRLLAASLLLWVPLLVLRQFHGFFDKYFGRVGLFLGTMPQMLVGVAMIIVLFEHERRLVQENALVFSTLDVDANSLLSPAEAAPALLKLLDRFMRLCRAERAAISIAERWRAVLPSVSRGFDPTFTAALENEGAGEYLSDIAFRRGGLGTLRNVAHMTEPLPAGAPRRFERCQAVLGRYEVRSLTAVSLQTREHNFGVVLFPHDERRVLGTSQVRLLLGVAMQIGLTLENYVVMNEAKRRTREYELLTQMGQVISSRLDSDEVLRSIQKELGLLFDTETFYVAFLADDELRFEFESVKGEVLPKRSRKTANAMTEYVIRSGQPLLVRSDMEKVRARLGLTFVPDIPAKSYCAAPIFINNHAVGVLAVMNFDREFVYEQRDLELLQTAAGQVAVAIENARLFKEQQRRSRYLAFLNNVSKAAISSQDAERMLAEIASEIQQNFDFDHIGIGMLDYVTKEIEIKAEAGATSSGAGKRVPLGAGIIGRCARSSEMVLVQDGDAKLASLLPDARSVLCLPLTYGESLLGVLNIESRREKAFADQEVLILRTLADLLATALHNAFVFQKLQQQSITDSLTGIKTRRFFLENLQTEWKRASRSGRPFSVALIDLDKFKAVNDTSGHLEGDLVLTRVGRLLEQKSRQSNVVARYGGDEFVILMPETGAEQAQILSERLRLWIATDPMLNERQITGSFGVASFPLHGATAEEVLRVADAGMYVSKRAGGNCVSIAEEFLGSGSAIAQRQLLTAFIEGFLQREHTGPESVQELTATIKKMCAATESRESLMEALCALSRASEGREVHAAGLAETAARDVEMLGHELGMVEDELQDVTYAARVHDLGKLILPEKILCKPGPLTEDEFYLVKMHPAVGAEIVSCIPASDRLQEIIKHHHERFDGAGYPDGLRGEQIPLGSRMLAVVDGYLTMMTDRPFAPRLSQAEAMAELERCSGTQFDGMLVRLYLAQVKGKHKSVARSQST
ncbi:MAG: diguanylate cyclase [Acidobacteriia bacterium]|nr:diguanylate cyclase [Terriglobia bacterium]